MRCFEPEQRAPDYVRSFVPYQATVPQAELERLAGRPLQRLHNNENPLGPPPGVTRVLREARPQDLARYPSGDALYLRRALAEKFGGNPELFLPGNGSCESIAQVIKAFCRPGDNIVTADRTFAVYEWVARTAGLEVRVVPLREQGFDPPALLDAVDNRTRVIFVCNPNNPTGGCWSLETLRDFLDAVAGRQVVVLDEAYAEFVERPDYPQGMTLLDAYPNLVVFRTFSKMYGLSGLRVGYLCAERRLVDILRRVAIAYSVNSLAQGCAVAALADDQEHILATRAMVASARDYLVHEAARLGLPCITGEGNFLMLRTPMPDSTLFRRLLLQGYWVRTLTDYRFPNWIRVSLSLPEIMRGFVAALEEVMTNRMQEPRA